MDLFLKEIQLTQEEIKVLLSKALYDGYTHVSIKSVNQTPNGWDIQLYEYDRQGNMRRQDY